MAQFDQREQQVDTQYNIGRDLTIHLPPVSKAAKQEQRNRENTLKRVAQLWLVEYMGKSLPGDVQKIVLRLEEQPDAVLNPWPKAVQEFQSTPGPFPPDTSLIQVYDQADGVLLILGEPGSGKTILLLDLLRELLMRASQDDLHPLPMVFLLSSWASRQLPLATWLVEELVTKYRIDRPIARKWIGAGAILPLLDSLDEVEMSARAACLDAINTYRDAHSSTPLAVCSRSADYQQLIATTDRKLHLNTAVRIQPLTKEQITSHLENSGKQVEALQEALDRDPDLLALAKAPLLLNLLIETYQGASPGKIDPPGSSTIGRQQIFEAYVHQMFIRRREDRRYNKQQTYHWLAYLARQLLRSHQTQFYLERMQFDWLPQDQVHRLTLSTVVLFKTLIGLSVGLTALRTFGPLWGLAFALIAGGYLMKSELVNGEIDPAEQVRWSWASLRRHLFDSLRSGLIAGLSIVLFVLLASLLSIFLILFSFLGLPPGIASLLSMPIPFGADIPLSRLVAAGGIFVLGSGLFLLFQSGWSGEMLDERDLMKPNQGIWQSTRNSLMAGALSGLLGGLFFFTLGDPLDGLLCGWTIGLAFGLFNGGIASVKHLFLRISLRASGSIPRNYSRFLDFAAERALLCKVGGGYLFIHHLLLEYFADQPVSSHVQQPTGCATRLLKS